MKKQMIAATLIAAFCLLFVPSLGVTATAADIPAGNNEFGFVTDMKFFPTSVANSPGEIPGFVFSPDETDYDLVITDTNTTPYVSFDISEPLAPNLFRRWLFDGDTIQGFADAAVNNANYAGVLPFSGLNKCLIGETHTLTLLVGQKYDGEFVNSDVYNFRVTRKPGLKSGFALKTSTGGAIALSPTFNVNSTAYVDSFSAVTAEETVKLTATANAGIYIGDSAAPFVSGSEITLANYTATDSAIAVIPIMLKYNVQGNIPSENTYTLYVSNTDYRPEISAQPQGVSIDKDETAALSVEANLPASGEGVLSYQWRGSREINGNGAYLVTGATDAVFNPPTTYAGITYYDCIVTNTVDGVRFTATSARVPVSVALSYVTAPQITDFPSLDGLSYFVGVSPHFNLSAVYFDNNSGTKNTISVKWYQNTASSVVGGAEAGASVENYSLSGKTERHGADVLTSYEPGVFYYYCVVTATIDGKTASTTSNIVAVNFLSLDEVLSTLDGKGTADDPYLINSYADLLVVHDFVNSGNTLQGINLKLTADIELALGWTPIGKLKNTDNVTVPIGDIHYTLKTLSVTDAEGRPAAAGGANVNPFSGTLDGGGHTITVAPGGWPLLSYVRYATVKNLNIYGERINGSGLVLNHFVDYGEDGDSQPYDPDTTVTVENVRLKSGSSTLRSGLVEGSGSGMNRIFMRNCVIEKDVIIGYDKAQENVASFAAEFSGTVSNCVSYATIYGTDYVGGIIGRKNQSMGPCTVDNSAFLGKIEASGRRVGGIIGGGYIAASAPNTPTVSVKNCYVAADITGANNVGGILGDESGAKAAMNNSWITDNFFYGSITSDNTAGGIIGILGSYSKGYQIIANNCYYMTDGSEPAGIGDLHNGSNPDYALDVPAACMLKTADEFADGTVLALLNAGEYSNWIQGELFPILDATKVVLTGLEISGEYKAEYYIGDELDLTGIKFTALWSSGERTDVNLSEVAVVGYDNTKRAVQTLLAAYRGLSATFQVTVLKKPDESNPNNPASNTINVSFTLLGAPVHDSETDGKFYLKKNNNLETWIAKKTHTVDLNAKVLDVFDKALREAGLIYNIRDMNNYIYAITRNGVELKEFTNGRNSGWTYMLNGRYSLLGVNEQFLDNGDDIVFHYTDDWTKDEAADIVDPTGEWRGGSTPTVAPGAEDAAGGIPTATVEIETVETFGGDGGDTVKVEVKGEDIEAAVDKAKEDNTAAVSVTVKGDANTRIADVTLPKSSAKEIADSGLEFVVKSPVGDVSFSKDALGTITSQAGDTLEIIIADEGKTETAATDNKAFSLTVKVGDAKLAALGGSVAVALPYAKAADEDAELLTVYRLGADGSYAEIKGAKYDTATGKAVFATSETGAYIVSEWISPFADIKKSDWYYKAVRYAYASGLMNGTGDDEYSPQTTLTRAMLITILAREAGSDTNGGDAWYSKAIEWGVENGITDGTNPDGEITREQFALMLYRYAGSPRPNGGFDAYSDAADVSSYAEDAMAWAVESGIITGRTETTLAPEGTATRAEAATLLQRYLENVN
ncbi:MAG: S-layer homology domain-containing protein [Clostridiales Family XIII bacterium]|jgi:hypothetical protein|nr:S-layer homology domain-containing protein [Clostridiales Family XIII bacterium]